MMRKMMMRIKVSKEFLFDRVLDALEHKHETKAKNLIKQLGESNEQ